MKGLVAKLASNINAPVEQVQEIVSATLMKAKGDNQQASPAEIASFLIVANEYKLNPITKEIYAFNNRGAIQPIVSIDGWMRIINSNPMFDGMEFDDCVDENGKMVSITCRIYRKDREKPTAVTEYLAECCGTSDPWKRWPARMLRHKATIQCARYAFGLSGIVDPDEAERMETVKPVNDATVVDATLNAEQVQTLQTLIAQKGADETALLQYVSATALDKIMQSRFDELKQMLEQKADKATA